MLLESYRKEIFRPECNPNFQSLHCFAHLDQDVGEALPFLNAELGGYEYTREPPSVTFRTQGKIITVHPRLIAVNALKNEAEADKILKWLKREINQAWENRENIEPCYTGMPRPQVFEILKMLPKTNCKKCGQPTCMVFAAQAAEGGKEAGDCPELAQEQASCLDAYLNRFFADPQL
ncbi:(Fe-S)-binding protein [Dethiosulfatarculus sandiegensis]|uniref:Fe-S cluster protein n=1 Tax=Dethiosulfatarculus sandiegensis TaxID=1429043 RepID=A0A0D2HRC8_9BACT|nr:(Fe-S)-binding protein [Dethiosulfatarculus sandiegensis]KIX13108.1 Fe-S cluster protein [Dethiosulfatarculus sandiegensis]